MAVIFGSARIDEHGRTTGGANGDQKQTGTPDYNGEVSMQNYYMSSKGWYVIRAKKVEHAAAIANCMVIACNNKHLGYNQNNRYGIIRFGINATTDTGCDCSSTVRACVKEGCGVDPGDFNTVSEASTLAATGLFKPKFLCRGPSDLQVGDILVTCTKGHTVVVVSVDGKVNNVTPSDISISTGGTVTSGIEDTTVWASGNSSLASYINRISSSSNSARTKSISCITIHTAKTKGDIKKLAKLINSTEVCYNYGIDNDGVIGLFADESYATNSSGNKDNDNRSVNIVCMNSKLEPDYEISEACYSSLIDLCEDICQRNFIFKLAYRKTQPDQSTLTFHQQFKKSSGCPGNYLVSKVKEFTEEVNDRLNSNTSSWVTVTSYQADSDSAALRAQSTVSLGAINPYVARIRTIGIKVDYKALRKVGVIGVVFNAGEKIDSKHNVLPAKSNQELYAMAEEAKAANLPFGYEFTTHAQSIADVKTECDSFFYIANHFSAKLGVWIRPDFKKTNQLGHEIIDKFYEYFVEWGYKSRCGIIASYEQARIIGWPTQCNYMPLWLEEQLDENVAPAEEVLTPSFFKLNDLTNKGYHTGDPVPELTVGSPLVPSDGTGGNSESATAERKVIGDYTKVIVPNDPLYTGVKKFEYRHLISDPTAPAYKVSWDPAVTIDSQGFAKLDNRFLVAVGYGVTSEAGAYVDVCLEDGNIIPCIVGDLKQKRHTDSSNILTNVNTVHCCSEFIVDKDKLDATVKKMGDCSYRQSDWKRPVKYFYVYRKNWRN